jgi:hypothetical protein
VPFRQPVTVQTTVEYRRSAPVRRDVKLKKVGEFDPAPRSVAYSDRERSAYCNKRFQVVGSIPHESEDGGWNECQVVFDDGTSGRPLDAQPEYAVLSQATTPERLPAGIEIARSHRFRWCGARYEVTSITRPYDGLLDGELPFEDWNKNGARFAGFRTPDARFVTIDYGEPGPLVSPGEGGGVWRSQPRRTSDGAILDRRASETTDLRNILEC